MKDKIKDIIRKNLPMITDKLREAGISVDDSEADFIDDENLETAIDVIYLLYEKRVS